jgi:hypothetical protein
LLRLRWTGDELFIARILVFGNYNKIFLLRKFNFFYFK